MWKVNTIMNNEPRKETGIEVKNEKKNEENSYI
jgi:hypothetical protein